MSKLHRDNAGYVGCSYEETQDPYYSYNKLSLPLSESDKTVIQDEETITVTQANSKFVLDGTSQKAVSLVEGGVFTFDQSDSSNSGHPLRFSEYADGTHGDKFGIFNGTDARYLREGSGNLLANSQPVTIEAHIKPNTNVIRGFFDGGSGQGSIIRNYGGNTFAKQAQESNGATIPTSEVKVGEWQHLAVIFGSGANNGMPIWVFIDGVRVATGFLSSGYTGGSTFDIGTINQGGDGKFDGLIRNFRVTFGTLYPYNFTAPAYTSDLTSTAPGYELARVYGQLNTNAYDDAFAQVNPRQMPFTLPSNYDCLDFQCVPTATASSDFTIEFGSAGASYDAYYLDQNSNWQSLGSFTNAGNSSRTFTPGAPYQAIRLYSTTGDLGQVVIQSAYYETSTASARLLTMVTSLTDTSGSGRGLTNNNNVVLGPTEYTTGVTATGTPGQAGAKTEIVVPFGAPDLYYYCSVHPGYGSSAVTPANAFMFDGALPILKTTDAFGKTLGTGNNEDPFAANLVLAVPMAGGNFNDIHANIKGSGTNKNVDISGVTSNSNSHLYGSAGEFVGATDHLQFYGAARDNTPDFAFAANEDFTAEAWIWWDSDNQTGNTGSIIADYYEGNGNASPNWQFVRRNGGVLGIWWNNNGTTVSIETPAGAMSDKNWHHVVVQRKGSTFEFIVDGDIKSSHTASGYSNAIGRGRSLWVGVDANESSEDFCGYIQDLRVYKGVAKYTSDFFVPTPVDVLDRSGNGNNASNFGATWQTSVKKFYGGAVEFDGNADENAASRLSVSDGLTFNSDFTIEFWAYPSTSPDHSVLFDCWQNQASGTGFYLWAHSSGAVDIVKDTNTYYLQSFMSAGSISVNAWNHIAIVRSGNVVTGYSNGSPRGNYTVSDNWTSTKGMIGSGTGNSTMKGFAGYLQDFKHYGGIAKYTSSFSPPERSVQGTARRYPSGVYVVS